MSDVPAHSEQISTADTEPAEPGAGVAGERHIPSVNRVRSWQSRVTTLLTVLFMCTLAVSLLGWYYARAFARAETPARATQERGALDSFLPLPASAIDGASTRSPIEAVLGPAPVLPTTAVAPPSTAAARSQQRAKPDRPLTGPVYARQQRSGAHAATTRDVGTSAGGVLAPLDAPASSDELSPLLQTSARDGALASSTPTPRWILPPGTTIDCTLETAINSSLPGMTRCVTATDTWSADGSVILLNRGSQIIGETRGQVQQGMARIFVLWTQARTPEHVIVPLASPGTDARGRSGVSGDVDTHFAQRFGAALLISVIDGAIEASRPDHGGDSIVISPNSSRDLMTEVLRHTLQIRPTVGVHQGARVQIFVARSVDFGGVYALRNRDPR